MDIAAVIALGNRGLSHYEIARRTGVSRSTVHRWLSVGPPARAPSQPPKLKELPAEAYAYLLGIYLGDGCITRVGGSYRLEVFQDAAYPGSALEIQAAMAAVSDARVQMRRPDRAEMLIIASYWIHWPVVFPQHGPGRKHERAISLEDWQLSHTHRHPKAFMRGLMHSDGCRYVARQKCLGKVYAYERYSFKNRSADIRRIFTDHLRLLGVHWTYSAEDQIDVNRRADVARLDEFVGAKY